MPVSATQYVTSLASRGRYTFTAAQAQAELGGSGVAVQAALRRLRKKGEIALPANGFYVIVPPEYRHLGCLPAAELVPELMAYLRAPYYAGLLTAAQIHGAAHHKPQVFQVVTNRNRRPLGAGRVRIVFIAKANLETTPTTEEVTERGYLRVSTPEATAFDLVIYSGHAGGLDNVATVLAEPNRRRGASAAGRGLTRITERSGERSSLVEPMPLPRERANHERDLCRNRPDLSLLRQASTRRHRATV